MQTPYARVLYLSRVIKLSSCKSGAFRQKRRLSFRVEGKHFEKVPASSITCEWMNLKVLISNSVPVFFSSGKREVSNSTELEKNGRDSDCIPYKQEKQKKKY